MAVPNLKTQHQHWQKDEFFISTNPDIIPVASVNAAFATDEVYWAKPLPEDVMKATLQNSLSFGLYEIVNGTTKEAEDVDICHTQIHQIPSLSHDITEGGADSSTLRFVGLARCITDFTTFLYLTDVYVKPSYQGKGVGKWLVSCVQEVIESMPHLRRSLLFTGDWKRSVPFYEKTMDMTLIESRRTEGGTNGVGLAVLMRKGMGHP